MSSPKPLLIAHRGESFDAPENTPAAFDLAWQRGCDAIELDVHVTADGEVVVCHDRDTLRTGGVKHVIAQSMLATLQTLDVGAWKGSQWAGQKFATLAAVLARVPEGKQAFVEIKSGLASVEYVMDVLDEFRQTHVTVIAFDREVVKAVKQCDDRPALWLVSPKRDEHSGVWSPSPLQMIDTAMQVGDGLDIDANSPVDAAFIREAKSAGLSFYVWTVDDAARARELAAMGVDGITSNRAAWLRGQFALP